ncbi:helix-turn-helix domain-containing protein [Deinococcus humi]|uniref:Excisionase family DNA binding protein n=1 Tax=Deinococcus humi TaxID=662880 RepID=A0A7W8JX30_9DEIO|nr:helix-turn-helix domain-containing protein [Deinococcus humi]MBB5364836.1 excisionase family DNA binding protein [Deinococcus humi]GGO33951.1 hypothetical protein GCM10008949_34000 [Deinococcus humi]
MLNLPTPSTTPALPTYYTVEEAAEHLKVHKTMLYREIRAGRLIALQIGTKILRIAHQDLIAYIGDQTFKGGPEER